MQTNDVVDAWLPALELHCSACFLVYNGVYRRKKILKLSWNLYKLFI